MDQDLYRRTYQPINHHACLFEKAILAAHCQCHHAHRFNLAEREGVQCRDNEACRRCCSCCADRHVSCSGHKRPPDH